MMYKQSIFLSIVILLILIIVGCSGYEFYDPTSAKIDIKYKNNTANKSRSYKNITSIKNNVSSNESTSYKLKNVNSYWRVPFKTHMLAVGVSSFKDPSFDNLKYSANDANFISSFLNSSGVPRKNITRLTNNNATKRNILNAFIKLKMSIKDSEIGVFYFSGKSATILEHGKFKDAKLITYDTSRNDLADSGVSLSKIQNLLTHAQGTWIIILDTCFNGKGVRSVVINNAQHIDTNLSISNIISKNSKAFWLKATSKNYFVSDYDKKNLSLFTYHFVKALNGSTGVDINSDNLITLKESFRWTKQIINSISKNSLDKPQYPKMFGKDDIILTILHSR